MRFFQPVVLLLMLSLACKQIPLQPNNPTHVAGTYSGTLSGTHWYYEDSMYYDTVLLQLMGVPVRRTEVIDERTWVEVQALPGDSLVLLSEGRVQSFLDELGAGATWEGANNTYEQSGGYYNYTSVYSYRFDAASDSLSMTLKRSSSNYLPVGNSNLELEFKGEK
ncbi:MAG: hypothetical protein OHK0039_14530 [Bacteroidia bacterium]